jgi:hypothetical protein
VKQQVRRGIIRHVDVGPAIVVKIREQHAKTGVTGIRDAGGPGDVGKRAVTVVPVQHVRLALQALWAAVHVDHHELAVPGFAALRNRVLVELHIIGDVQVHEAIAIVVSKRAPGAPPGVANVRPLRHVRECAIAVVVKQHIGADARHVEIRKTVVVVVGDAHAIAPATVHEPAPGGHVFEVPLPVVVVQRHHRVAALLDAIARRTIDDQQIEVAVIVVVEPRSPAAIGVDDVVFGGTAAEVEQRHARARRDIDQFDHDIRADR